MFHIGDWGVEVLFEVYVGVKIANGGVLPRSLLKTRRRTTRVLA